MDSVFTSANTAIITGGASGIGLAIAAKCYSYGMKVVIADLNTDLLERARASIGEGTIAVAMDVSKVEEWDRLKRTVSDDLAGRVNLLVLNAGIGPKSNWEDVSGFRKIMDTNFFGVINGINALLQDVKQTAATSPAAIVITGSKQGITNPPGNPAYNASKAAVKIAAEHLSYDLRNTANIAVHLLVPGWTFTGLSGGPPAGDAKKPAGAWSPEQVADFLESKMGQGTFYILCPDNEVDEATDRKRMLWGAGDAIYGRPPLSRWRTEWQAEAKEWIDRSGV